MYRILGQLVRIYIVYWPAVIFDFSHAWVCALVSIALLAQWVRSQVALGCLYLWHTGAVLGHDFVRPKAILGLK